MAVAMYAPEKFLSSQLQVPPHHLPESFVSLRARLHFGHYGLPKFCAINRTAFPNILSQEMVQHKLSLRPSLFDTPQHQHLRTA